MIDVAVDPEVAAAFPGYRALIVVTEGIGNGPSDAKSDALLRAVPHPPLARATDHPHVAAWRAAFSAFGAKPSRFPPSVEALLSRVLKGQELPRVNRLVDLYNAISVSHVVPVGGEDLDRIEPRRSMLPRASSRRSSRPGGRAAAWSRRCSAARPPRGPRRGRERPRRRTG